MKLSSGLLYRLSAPLTDEAKARMRMNMMVPVDERIVGDYELHLVHSPMIPYPQIGLQKNGMDFTDIAQQQTKVPSERGDLNMGEIKAIITEWLEEYGGVTVGTFDERKLRTYKALLTRMRFKTQMVKFGFMDILVVKL